MLFLEVFLGLGFFKNFDFTVSSVEKNKAKRLKKYSEIDPRF